MDCCFQEAKGSSRVEPFAFVFVTENRVAARGEQAKRIREEQLASNADGRAFEHGPNVGRQDEASDDGQIRWSAGNAGFLNYGLHSMDALSESLRVDDAIV